VQQPAVQQPGFSTPLITPLAVAREIPSTLRTISQDGQDFEKESTSAAKATANTIAHPYQTAEAAAVLPVAGTSSSYPPAPKGAAPEFPFLSSNEEAAPVMPSTYSATPQASAGSYSMPTSNPAGFGMSPATSTSSLVPETPQYSGISLTQEKGSFFRSIAAAAAKATAKAVAKKISKTISKKMGTQQVKGAVARSKGKHKAKEAGAAIGTASAAVLTPEAVAAAPHAKDAAVDAAVVLKHGANVSSKVRHMSTIAAAASANAVEDPFDSASQIVQEFDPTAAAKLERMSTRDKNLPRPTLLQEEKGLFGGGFGKLASGIAAAMASKSPSAQRAKRVKHSRRDAGAAAGTAASTAVLTPEAVAAAPHAKQAAVDGAVLTKHGANVTSKVQHMSTIAADASANAIEDPFGAAAQIVKKFDPKVAAQMETPSQRELNLPRPGLLQQDAHISNMFDAARQMQKDLSGGMGVMSDVADDAQQTASVFQRAAPTIGKDATDVGEESAKASTATADVLAHPQAAAEQIANTFGASAGTILKPSQPDARLIQANGPFADMLSSAAGYATLSAPEAVQASQTTAQAAPVVTSDAATTYTEGVSTATATADTAAHPFASAATVVKDFDPTTGATLEKISPRQQSILDRYGPSSLRKPSDGH